MERGLALVDMDTGRVLVPRVSRTETASERLTGLLDRAGLEAGEGLCLDACRMIHTVGMRFPIDLVYGDAGGRIRKVAAAVPVWRMSVCWGADWVLELAAGEAAAAGIVPEMRVAFRGAG